MDGISILRNFDDGGYAMRVYFDYEITTGKNSPPIEIKKGCVGIHDHSGKIVDCITMQEFEERYGVSTVRCRTRGGS